MRKGDVRRQRLQAGHAMLLGHSLKFEEGFHGVPVSMKNESPTPEDNMDKAIDRPILDYLQ